MKAFLNRSGIFLLLAAIMTFAIACSDDGDSEEEKRQAFCGDLESLENSFDTLVNRVTSLDTSGVLDSIDDIEGQVNDVRDSARELGDDQSDDVEREWQDVRDSVSNITDASSLSAGLRQVESSLQNFTSTVRDLISSYRCE